MLFCYLLLLQQPPCLSPNRIATCLETQARERKSAVWSERSWSTMQSPSSRSWNGSSVISDSQSIRIDHCLLSIRLHVAKYTCFPRRGVEESRQRSEFRVLAFTWTNAFLPLHRRLLPHIHLRPVFLLSFLYQQSTDRVRSGLSPARIATETHKTVGATGWSLRGAVGQ